MFENRRVAGEALALELARLKGLDPVVYALPRGGLPVAAAVVKKLGAPLELILVRKLGAPETPELAIGAAVNGAEPTVVMNDELLDDLEVEREFVKRVKSEAFAEIERRRAIFAAYRKVVSPKGRVVILVDDGLATGATVEAALEAMRRAEAKRVIVAVPTASMEATEKLRRLADEVVCLETPQPFCAVGNEYRNFPQLTDADVVAILKHFKTGSSKVIRRKCRARNWSICRS